MCVWCVSWSRAQPAMMATDLPAVVDEARRRRSTLQKRLKGSLGWLKQKERSSTNSTGGDTGARGTSTPQKRLKGSLGWLKKKEISSDRT